MYYTGVRLFYVDDKNHNEGILTRPYDIIISYIYLIGSFWE